MSLADDLDAMARAQSRREASVREADAPPPRRGRHRAPTSPFWALRPAPRHQRRPPAPAPATPPETPGPPAVG